MSQENINNSEVTSREQSQKQKNLPIVSSEDVEFSTEELNIEDVEAQERAAKANNQQNSSNK